MSKFYNKVFGWLFAGLLITFLSGYTVATSESLINAIFGSNLYWLIFIAQFVVVIILSARISKLQPSTAKLLYVLYTALTGLTFASLFLVFDVASIIFVFLATSIVFGVFALIGNYTKINLNKFGIYLFMTLLAIIVIGIINIFVMNNTLDMFLCILSIVVFMGYTAYDMQKIKEFQDDENDNLAILGAFELYIDFINLFIELLKLFAKERD